MVQIEFFGLEVDPAVLAGVLVSLKNVLAGKLHILFREPVKHGEHNDLRNAELAGNGVYHFHVGRVSACR